jgi:glycosyltransferase involved in cell wall biosynthesis
MPEPGADPTLRVGVLADTIDRPGGIARYTEELVAGLAARDDIRLIVGAPASAGARVAELAGDRLEAVVTVPALGQLGIALWERYASGPRFAAAGAEIVHGTKHLVPRTSLPTVLTIHDLMTITRAHESSPAKRLFLPRQYRTSITAATRLVAVSAATRDRLVAIDAKWGPKTVVVANGLSSTLVHTAAEPVAGLVDTRFALVVGDLAPRKNVQLLLDIWRDVACDTAGFRLVVLGHPGPHGDTTMHRLEELQSEGLAVWLRGASDAALRWCYEHATVVLFPTLEEGFGFPLLEARTFGAPVIASTDPALVEVSAGDARVEHVDADDPGAWRTAIARAAAVSREPLLAPHPPSNALTRDQNTEMVVELYRSLIRS